MKAKEIKELISFIADSGLDQVKIETDEVKLEIRRSAANKVIQTKALERLSTDFLSPLSPTPTTAVDDRQDTVPAPFQQTHMQQDNAALVSPNYQTIKSPMIGTFYTSSTPDAAPFVKVGDTIKKGQVLCIIEAMKLFNEIESEYDGKIAKVIAENASPVEYDQPLFLIEPA